MKHRAFTKRCIVAGAVHTLSECKIKGLLELMNVPLMECVWGGRETSLTLSCSNPNKPLQRLQKAAATGPTK